MSVSILTIITICLFAVGSLGFTAWDVTDTMQQFYMVGLLSLAAFLSTRTGGLDLSIGSVMALSSVILAVFAAENNAVAGFLLAFIVCGAFGLMNGLFIMAFRLPSILITIVSSMLAWGIAMWVGGGVSISLPPEWPGIEVVPTAIALLVSVGIVLFVLKKTGRLEKDHPHTFLGKKYFWIYGVVAVIGAFAGWAETICFGASDMSFGSGSSNEMIILFVFATISSTKLLKNNWIALGGVLILAMIWTVHDQAMILLDLNPFSRIVSNASWVIIMLCVLVVAKRYWKNPPQNW